MHYFEDFFLFLQPKMHIFENFSHFELLTTMVSKEKGIQCPLQLCWLVRQELWLFQCAFYGNYTKMLTNSR